MAVSNFLLLPAAGLLLVIRFVVPSGEIGDWDVGEAGLLRNDTGDTLLLQKPALLLPWVVILPVVEHQADSSDATRSWLWFWRDSMDTQGWSRIRRVALNVNQRG